MTVSASVSARPAAPSALFAVTVFASAALVFMVEPMVAKLVLPRLGGSSSVWNTSLAFFQTALLAGYGYAHALQRLRSIRTQAIVHGVALVAAALVLPLHINELFGPPSSVHPNLWLLGVLTVSIGAPFAVLSATAPLVQAWHARTVEVLDGREPYVLYAASNFGSLLALLAYPLVVEPTLTVPVQTWGWSAGYLVFILLMTSLAFTAARAARDVAVVDAPPADAPPIRWKDRLAWIALAAIPSSLMLGVTTHITTDVASAPFLWVAPLALYLLTFIIAFQAKPAIPRDMTLVFQGAALAGCVALTPFGTTNIIVQIFVHLSAFFLTALMCHQALVARRPDPARLTEFYLWMSFGGVVGGSFNAFLAPVIFENVWEYPLVLVLSCLARPWGEGKVGSSTWVMMMLGVAASLTAVMLGAFVSPHINSQPIVGGFTQHDLLDLCLKLCLATAMVSAFLVRSRAWPFFGLIAVLAMSSYEAAERSPTTHVWRSFFGVLTQSQTTVSGMGPVNMLAHGTTLHGAQAVDPRWRCRPLVYYAYTTPIGQVFRALEREKPAIRIGAVGLGTGSVSAYVRAADRLTFFEIDPLVIRISTNPEHFSYTTLCAKGPVDYVVGDARLTVAKQPEGVFDVLLIDAFSSDAVPAHLLTVEAVRGYLTHLKPDGVLVLHLSNRNLDLKGPAMAVAKAAGGVGLEQEYQPSSAERTDWASPEEAVIVGRSHAALDRFATDRRWKPIEPDKVRPWTDNYTNLFGALWRRTTEKLSVGFKGR
jgi:SAM-dependent methyltransferase